MTYVPYINLTNDEKLQEYFVKMNVMVNQVYSENIQNPLYRKAFELLTEDKPEYFTFISSNGQKFLEKSAPFLIYSTLYVALTRNLFGIFDYFKNVFREILVQNAEKDKMMENFLKLFVECLERNKGVSQFEGVFKNEIDKYQDCVNLIGVVSQGCYLNIFSQGTLESFFVYVMNHPEFTISEKSLTLLNYQVICKEKNFKMLDSVRFVYGVDDKNVAIVWYDGLDMNKVIPFKEYGINESLIHSDALNEFEKQRMVQFFLFMYTFYLNDFILKPLKDEGETDNNKLFFGIFNYVVNKFSEVNPERYRKRSVVFELSDSMKKFIDNFYDMVISDNSLVL